MASDDFCRKVGEKVQQSKELNTKGKKSDADEDHEDIDLINQIDWQDQGWDTEPKKPLASEEEDFIEQSSEWLKEQQFEEQLMADIEAQIEEDLRYDQPQDVRSLMMKIIKRTCYNARLLNCK